MISLDVLNISRCAQDILQYNQDIPQSTHGISPCIERPPVYLTHIINTRWYMEIAYLYIYTEVEELTNVRILVFLRIILAQFPLMLMIISTRYLQIAKKCCLSKPLIYFGFSWNYNCCIVMPSFHLFLQSYICWFFMELHSTSKATKVI